MPHLERFTRAQHDARAGLAAAVGELRAGRKAGHWIWYVFPQLAGLGRSGMAQTYAIADIAEARDYLRNAVLRDRLLLAATSVREQVRAGVPLARLMGASIDVLKLVSSLTLFGRVAARLQASEPTDEYPRLVEVSEEILTAAEAQGYARCPHTLRALGESE